MMMPGEKADEELGPVAIPDHDANWKSSVSIGGCVCFFFCAVQVFAYCKPAAPKRNKQEDGVELKN